MAELVAGVAQGGWLLAEQTLPNHDKLAEKVGAPDVRPAEWAATVRYYTHIMPDALRSAQARLPYADLMAESA